MNLNDLIYDNEEYKSTNIEYKTSMYDKTTYRRDTERCRRIELCSGNLFKYHTINIDDTVKIIE